MRGPRIMIALVAALILVSAVTLHLCARKALLRLYSEPLLGVAMGKWLSLGVSGVICLSFTGYAVFALSLLRNEKRHYWVAAASLLITVLTLQLATLGLLAPLLTMTRVIR